MYQEKISCLFDLFDDDLDILKEVSQLFCSYIPDTLAELNEAKLANDRKSIFRILHRVKGSVGYLGFELEAKLVMEYEKQAQEQDLEQLDFTLLNTQLSTLVTLVKSEVLARY